MITFICDASAETHLISNIKQFNPLSLIIRNDLTGDNRIKVEIIVSSRELSKVIDYLKQYYVKPYNGVVVYLTGYYTWYVSSAHRTSTPCLQTRLSRLAYYAEDKGKVWFSLNPSIQIIKQVILPFFIFKNILIIFSGLTTYSYFV